MGTRNQHREKAKRNQGFIDSIRDSEYHEWTATAIFYKAVHVVEELFSLDGVHTTSHRHRRSLLKSKYPEIGRPFRTLFNYALIARYKFSPVRKADLEPLEKQLSTLEQYVAAEITAQETGAS